jgi:hypothetical protein
MIPQASTDPANMEMAELRPISIPLPMKAGVHSMNHPQFSIFKAQFLYPLQIKNLKKINERSLGYVQVIGPYHVKTCQSYNIPTA